MSDARQAIAVAREAGAEGHAADDLDAAEQFLESAQRNLSERLQPGTQGRAEGEAEGTGCTRGHRTPGAQGTALTL
jgi:hypothetical protein